MLLSRFLLPLLLSFLLSLSYHFFYPLLRAHSSHQALQYKDPDSSLQYLSDCPFTCGGVHILANFLHERRLLLLSSASLCFDPRAPHASNFCWILQLVINSTSCLQPTNPSPAAIPCSTCVPTFGVNKKNFT